MLGLVFLVAVVALLFKLTEIGIGVAFVVCIAVGIPFMIITTITAKALSNLEIVERCTRQLSGNSKTNQGRQYDLCRYTGMAIISPILTVVCLYGLLRSFADPPSTAYEFDPRFVLLCLVPLSPFIGGLLGNYVGRGASRFYDWFYPGKH